MHNQFLTCSQNKFKINLNKFNFPKNLVLRVIVELLILSNLNLNLNACDRDRELALGRSASVAKIMGRTRSNSFDTSDDNSVVDSVSDETDMGAGGGPVRFNPANFVDFDYSGLRKSGATEEFMAVGHSDLAVAHDPELALRLGMTEELEHLRAANSILHKKNKELIKRNRDLARVRNDGLISDARDRLLAECDQARKDLAVLQFALDGASARSGGAVTREIGVNTEPVIMSTIVSMAVVAAGADSEAIAMLAAENKLVATTGAMGPLKLGTGSGRSGVGLRRLSRPVVSTASKETVADSPRASLGASSPVPTGGVSQARRRARIIVPEASTVAVPAK
jgi:hypothetical protein